MGRSDDCDLMAGSLRIGLGALLFTLLSACAGSPASHSSGCEGCPELALLPAGHFIMGTPDGDDESWGAEREGPPHEVRISRTFAMGRFEVTRAQYARFIAEAGEAADGGGACGDWNGSGWVGDAGRNWRSPGFIQGDNDPVVCVSWADAQRYAAWLSARTGRHYRLPSEAEWEYAARAGTTTRRPWGNAADSGCTFANVADQTLWQALLIEPAVGCADGHVHTAPTGSLAPNAWGLHDMLGNVWEWTADCWFDGYAGAPVDGSPRDSPGCSRRVNRGAAWNSNPRNVRSSNRGNYDANSRYNIVGFRIARD